ncbi:MAG: GGDEF domain-containing protein [Eubacteriales bacterium]
MSSFLLYIDKQGKINEVKWSSLTYIISMHNQSFYEIFPNDIKTFLYNIIGKGQLEENEFYWTKTVPLNDREAEIKLCLLPLKEQILVFGISEQLEDNGEFNREFKNIVQKFMNAIKEYSKNNIFHNKEAVQFQFEKIQILNNELINTRRMLEKANAQLNNLNSELNNRLVKDALTGLISKYQYRAEIEYFVHKNPDKLGVFTFMDIDNFKAVNDTYGHATGDQYLIEFAQRLMRLPIDNTIKLRISGDEFGIFTYGLDDASTRQIEEIWNKIKENVLYMPIEIDKKSIPLSISAGMAVLGQDTHEIYEVIEYADMMMYEAKRSGKNCFKIFDKVRYQLLKGIANPI